MIKVVTSELYLFIYFTVKPTLTVIGGESVAITETRTGRFNCGVVTRPQSTFLWQLDGAPIPQKYQPSVNNTPCTMVGIKKRLKVKKKDLAHNQIYTKVIVNCVCTAIHVRRKSVTY